MADDKKTIEPIKADFDECRQGDGNSGALFIQQNQ
jgi:hypothetical protein